MNTLKININSSSMRLLHAATLAFLGWRTAQAIPPNFGTDDPGLIVEKATPSGQFDDPELQDRSSRFLNKVTAREFYSKTVYLYCPDKYQRSLSMVALSPTLHGTSVKATLAFYLSRTSEMRQGSCSSGTSRLTIPSQVMKSWSGVCESSAQCLLGHR